MEDINKIVNIILYSCLGLISIFVISFIINLYQLSKQDTGSERVKKSITYYLLMIFKIPLTILKPLKLLFYYIWPFDGKIFKNDPSEADKRMIGCAWEPKNRLKTIIVTLTIFMISITSSIIFNSTTTETTTETTTGTTTETTTTNFFNSTNIYEKIIGFVSLGFTAILVIKAIILYYRKIPKIPGVNNTFSGNQDTTNNSTNKEKYEKDTKWLLNTSMSYLKLITTALVLLGGLAVGCYFILLSEDASKIATYFLLGFSFLLLLLFIYSYIKDLNIINKLLNNKVFQFIYYGIFLIPCLILEFIDIVYKELKYTPNTAWLLLVIELFFIIFYIIGPIITKSFYLNVHKKKDNNLINDEIKALEKENIVLRNDIDIIKNHRFQDVTDPPQKSDAIPDDQLGEKKRFKYTLQFWNKVLTESWYASENIEELETELENLKGDENKQTSYIFNNNDVDDNFMEDAIYNRKDKEIEYIQHYGQKIRDKEQEIEDNNIKIKQLRRKITNNDGLPKTTVIINKPVPLNEKHIKCGEKWHFTIRNKKFVGYDDNGKEIYQVVDEEEGGYNYNFAISKWLFIHSQAPNYYIGDSKKKIIGFRHMDNDEDSKDDNYIKVSYNTNNGNIEINTKEKNIILKNIPHQKWINLVINYNSGILDVFLDGKLVGTGRTNTLKLSKKAYLSVGEKQGVRGGLCNLVYFADSLTKQQIVNNYEMYKNKSPPNI
tara:strand:- start:1802 stop:3952 length:2151 start_codon:yes stop_codon:yes gene_type:complete